jgi:3-oxoacyl-[acyl-carrier protein] reductase
MELGIAGKNVLITGASKGLGRALALGFAAEGCRIGAVGRNESRLKGLVEDIGGPEMGHRYCVADLMQAGAPTLSSDELECAMGPFEIVVHNVGGPLDVYDALAPVEAWRNVWDFNVGIATEINARCIPKMIAKHWGRVIHIGSASGKHIRGRPAYAVAKACLMAYTEALGRSTARDGVVVSAVLPGAFWYPGSYWDSELRANPKKAEEFFRFHQAIGRFAELDEIVAFVLLLASKHASFAAGAVVPVDGGAGGLL